MGLLASNFLMKGSFCNHLTSSMSMLLNITINVEEIKGVFHTIFSFPSSLVALALYYVC